ncbi:type II secretion system protein [Geitlerinema sp. P-1104]|uniref:type IV pilus modification PilV family protein n=1 Tax=Geitlerinema sp. P-1104 TaxID=2546230 RepID=UPI001476FE32|nr:type II secretion system protein [Geitlerinema sp. P-1104]NMG60036.1 type II secretion system protein [Geitlerinema sp. P-1104]
MMDTLPAPWKQLILKQLPIFHKSRILQEDSGLTLIEGLVAILIVSAVIVGITPMMFISVATRVQNRRAEQAIQLAHGQIDQVRVLMEQGIITQEQIESQLPPRAEVDNIRDVPPPTGSVNNLLSTNSECPRPLRDFQGVSATQAFAVDINGDCQIDFYVQTFRTNEVTAVRSQDEDGVPIPIVFRMGVRVYYRNICPSGGFDSPCGSFGDLETEQASLVLTSGEGQQTTRPLSTLYTVMAQGDTRLSLDRYRSFLEDVGSP